MRNRISWNAVALALVAVLSPRALADECCCGIHSVGPLDWKISQADLIVRGTANQVEWHDNPEVRTLFAAGYHD